ncbi:MAG: polyphosphate kinase 1 [Candidatus Metalachnospira sp.]|nr:polyphosphate kinase 1 [Candidatus Metalachnospira sp.]
MPKDNIKYDLSYTQNRELSWLKFNQRVLEEATDPSVPLLERFKFLAIFSSNLDEFFMVRVGSLFDLSIMTPKERDNKSGKIPSEQLEDIFKAVKPLIEYRDIVYSAIMEELRGYGIADTTYDELTKSEKKFVENYYKLFIAPILSPQIIDISHPFPHLKNKALYTAVLLKKGQKELLGIIGVPETAEPIIRIEGTGKYIRTEEVISSHIKDYFVGYKPVCHSVISVTRNADISMDEEKFDEDNYDFRSHMSALLKKRDRLAPVRLEIQGECNPLSQHLANRLNLLENQIFYSNCPLKTGYVFSLANFNKRLYYDSFTPQQPSFSDNKSSIMAQIRKKDVLLFYPYHSMQPFLSLLKEAATNPNVLSIKITIYRLASSSAVAKYLCEAAENGKEVTALVELRARFDEKNNIEWAKQLEYSGCNVIYGLENFKCHSKVCLITMKTKNDFSYITQVGTGNYNEKTSAMYTDFSLMTADKAIAQDALAFFKNMLIGDLYGNYSELLVAPSSMKNSIIRLIEAEAARGSDGRIIIKANSITERTLIDKLAEASQKGVKINLIIRGICCIVPGIKGKTENITVTSIVGRFLEHSRIYLFGKGENSQIFISSADIMTRNQTRRVEIACPIYDHEIKNFLSDYLEKLMEDNVKSRILMPDGNYVKKVIKESSQIVDSQKWYIDNPPSLEKIKENKPSLFTAVKRLFFKICENEK